MAQLLSWPGKYYFYPIGNTPAVCLTRDVAPETDADILLLGCGDPRNVLYTIYSEPTNGTRKLDFTCSDYDPGILARNILLMTMVVDQVDENIVWNIFFHMYLDKKSSTTLIEHCTKLIDVSERISNWEKSPYSRFLKLSTEYTLLEVRRHWSLYVEMPELPKQRMDSIKNAFSQCFQERMKSGGTSTSARTAGPTIGPLADRVLRDQCLIYWKNGVTFSDPKQISALKLPNPTMAYSRAGEGCHVHYGTDPMNPFHLAPVFGNVKGSVTPSDVVRAAKAQFKDWCSSFSAAVAPNRPAPPIVRFFLGEATAVCRALRCFAESNTLSMAIPVSQFTTATMRLNRAEYVDGRAPVRFNVIETSNLDDYIGMFNILIATTPLLSSSQSDVIYTESLLFLGMEDATKEFTERLQADVSTMALLLGVCPLDYLSGFASRSNTHELISYQLVNKRNKKSREGVSQFHQVTTWKSPASGDALAMADGPGQKMTFDPRQLATLFYDIYFTLFELEDMQRWWERYMQYDRDIAKAVGCSNILHYSRETFVLLLKLVRERLHVSDEQWMEVMDRFFDIRDSDTTLKMDSVNLQDLSSQLFYHGVYVRHYIAVPRSGGPKVGVFSQWETVTPLARIIFTIPREKLAPLEDPDAGTPTLICYVQGKWSCNLYSSLHLAYGTAIKTGTSARPSVIFKEDPEGRNGSSPLVASFIMSSMLLAMIEPAENQFVHLAVKTTASTHEFTKKLGLGNDFFKANITDESHVIIIPEQPLSTLSRSTQLPQATMPSGGIGPAGPVTVDLDQECEVPASFTCRLSVADEDIKTQFGSKAVTPEVSQESACTMKLTCAGRSQLVAFPFPVIGSEFRLRLARKSSYIEIIVPPSGPFESEGTALNRFPVIPESDFGLWSVHRVNLARLPAVDLTARKLSEWLDPHLGSIMSHRERILRKKKSEKDVLMLIKDSLHAIMVGAAGVQQGPPRRLFSLREDATNNSDTVFFIDKLRYDVHSYTVVCDAFVLPLTKDFLDRHERTFSKLITEGHLTQVSMGRGEVQAWKQFLPALVERCRTSWTHGKNCEYVAQGRVPLTTAMEAIPICSCGSGKDTAALLTNPLWKPFAPHSTRIALSPLFAVSYLERVIRDPSQHKCSVCRGKGKPKLKACGGCQKVRYCSEACQKKDWKTHKDKCKK